MKAVFLDYATMGTGDLDLSPLHAALPALEVFDSTSDDQRVARIADAGIVLCNKVRLDADVLRQAQELRYIGLAATGTDNIDLEFAARNGIAVCNLVAYCTESVVEHVFAVMLHLARRIGRYEKRVGDGGWVEAENFCLLDYPMRQLSAMTIGIVGYGELGKGVARVARAFGMQVMVARRIGTAGVDGDGRHDIEDLLRTADVISLHCPLDDDTRNLINAESLGLMKPDALLINTARGGLVDSTALVAALEAGNIGGAAIDVLAQEPPVGGDPLLEYAGPNLIVTPHIAWASREARQNAINELAENFLAFSNGEHRNRVA